MMSLHSSIHSSQMNTDGPAISFLTSCWLLPQKEQYKTFSLELPFFSAMGVLLGLGLLEGCGEYRQVPALMIVQLPAPPLGG